MLLHTDMACMVSSVLLYTSGGIRHAHVKGIRYFPVYIGHMICPCVGMKYAPCPPPATTLPNLAELLHAKGLSSPSLLL